jgi:hypothetical protein
LEERNADLWIPALIAGALAGLLASLPLTNCCCCLWPIGAGLLAVFLVPKEARLSLAAGDGAVLGALTGIFAAIIRSLLMIPLQSLNMLFLRKYVFPLLMDWIEHSGQQPPAQLKDILQGEIPAQTVPGFFFDLLLAAVAFAGLAALGSIIAVSLIKKKRPPSAVEESHASQNSSHRQP